MLWPVKGISLCMSQFSSTFYSWALNTLDKQFWFTACGCSAKKRVMNSTTSYHVFIFSILLSFLYCLLKDEHDMIYEADILKAKYWWFCRKGWGCVSVTRCCPNKWWLWWMLKTRRLWVAVLLIIPAHGRALLPSRIGILWIRKHRESTIIPVRIVFIGTWGRVIDSLHVILLFSLSMIIL